MEIKYVGPFHTVVAGGITFTRNVPVTLLGDEQEKMAKQMLAAKDHLGKPQFVETQESLELNSPVLAST